MFVSAREVQQRDGKTEDVEPASPLAAVEPQPRRKTAKTSNGTTVDGGVEYSDDVEPSASPLAAAEPQLSNAKTSNGTTGDDGAGVESSDDVEPSASPLAAVDPLRYRAPHLPSWCRS